MPTSAFSANCAHMEGVNKRRGKSHPRARDGDESAVPFLEGEREELFCALVLLFVAHLTRTGVRAIVVKQHERSQQSKEQGHADRTDLSTQASRPADPSTPESGAAGSRARLEVLPRASPAGSKREEPLARPRRPAARNQGWTVRPAQSIGPAGLPAVPRQCRDHQTPAPEQPAASLSLPPQAVSHGVLACTGGCALWQAPDPAYGTRAQVPLLPSAHLPDQIGAVSLVWHGGYQLHLVVPTPPAGEGSAPAAPAVQAAVDLGEIHLTAVTTTTGKGLIVTGRGIRSLKRGYNMTLGRLSRLQARCQKGSKRWRRLQYTKARELGKKERRVRDLRHKGTRQVVDFCRAERVQTLYVGDPMGCATKTRDAITTREWPSGNMARTKTISNRSVNESASCASVAVSGEPAATVHGATGGRSREDGTGPVGAVALSATETLSGA